MNIGIFGGSFNPIHNGHGMLANYISQYTDIDKLWLMPSPQNPLKYSSEYSYDTERLRMCEMVSSKCSNVITSGLEFSLPRPSYTIDTLNAIAKLFPNDNISLIIGADNWLIFEKWKNYDEIIDKYHIFIYPRRGCDIIMKDLPHSVTYLVDAPLIDISSTFIREGIKCNKNMAFFIPADVYDFIMINSLYK